MTDSKLISAKDFSKKVGVSTVTVYEWIRLGKIKSQKTVVGFKNYFLIPESELEKFKT